MFENMWIWDEETFPNIFTFCAVYGNGKGIRVFEISDRKNEIEELIEFCRKVKKAKHSLVGFNSLGFDYPVLHHIIENYRIGNKLDAFEIYEYAMKVIDSHKGEGFGIKVKEDEMWIPQIDLFKIHHFDNKARATSLKMLEFNMRSDNIEDLPFPIGTYLTDEQKDVLVTYNKHDVMQTWKFLTFSKEHLDLRNELGQKFKMNCTNYNDTKIGKELFIQSLEKAAPGCCYQQGKYGRKIKQTKRDKIVIKDCLFNYIEFERPEFKAIHEWFKQQVITETKGVFADIPEYKLGDVAKYAEMVTKRKKIGDTKNPPDRVTVNKLLGENTSGWVEEKPLTSPKGHVSYYWCYRIAETLNVLVNGFRVDFGLGGVHGAKQGIIKTTDTHILRTLDVASYYPNMAIANEIYPAHLGKTFCKVYKGLYEERKKQPKGSAANGALKLALNGSYGETNNEFSPLYDPMYTMSITIGGQLSLCMLIEKLVDNCGAELVMCNTDGFEYLCPVDMVEQADKLVKQWEELTGLQMEGDTYQTMWIANVNNYIALYTNGKVKLKGAYEHFREKYGDDHYKYHGWHKNQSALVIPMAVEHELLGRGKAEDYIRSHQNHWDFMLRTKVDRSSRLVLTLEDGTEMLQQNICRYYPCTFGGGKLVKIMPPLKGKEDAGERPLGIDVEWNVVPCNDINNFSWDNLNYDYYIKEANKLVDAIVNKEQTNETTNL